MSETALLPGTNRRPIKNLEDSGMRCPQGGLKNPNIFLELQKAKRMGTAVHTPGKDPGKLQSHKESPNFILLGDFEALRVESKD